MDKIIQLFSNVRLKTKILTVSGIFLLGMVVMLIVGGYALTYQNKTIRDAVSIASQRVSIATQTKTNILQMDRAIQALIAADEKAQIRLAAISSIRAGAMVDETLNNLQQLFGEHEGVAELISSMKALRPKQMQVIGSARRNNDEQALKQAKDIEKDFQAISELSSAILKESENALNNDLEKSQVDASMIVKVLGVFGFIGVLLGLFIALIAARMMSRPLTEINFVMQALSEGDLTNDINASNQGKDEIGKTMRAIQETLHKLRDMVKLISNASSQITSSVHMMAGDAKEMAMAANDMDNSVSEIQQQTQHLGDTANSVSNQLEQASIDAQQASDTATDSSNQILQIVNDFEAFRSEIESTADKSNKLKDTAEKITSITQTISQISEQTNLLALNAAIEAARAGEQGRGFAVVADEVRTLAGHTSKAVDEISALIVDIHSSVNDTVLSMERVVDKANQNIGQLDKAAQQTQSGSEQIALINKIMTEISSSVESQTMAVENIANASNQLAQVSSQNKQQSDSLNNRSVNLGSASEDLKSVINQFSI